MREILFKAKTKLEVRQNNCRKQDGVWVFGFYRNKVDCKHLLRLISADYLDYEVDRETLCQSTGLTDKNGNKIFEGDIIWASGSYQLEVVWNKEDARFEATIIGSRSGHEDDDNDTYAEACDFNSFQIIGNIHDN